MDRLRRLLLSSILTLLFIPSLFAASYTDGSADHVLLFYPRAVTTDPEYAINISEASSLTTIGNTPLEFSTTSTNNLAIFRIYDTLANSYMSIPQYAGYRASNYGYSASQMFNVDNSVTLQIHTTGIFVKVDDPGVTRDFSLSCILNEAHIAQSGNSYELCQDYTNINMQSGQQYQLVAGRSNTYAEFTDLGSGDYELFAPSTPTVAINTGNGYYYPLYLRLFDICVKLDTPKSSERVEPGYYTTTITIESTTTYSNLIWRGTKGETGENRIDNDVLTMKMSQTITVYGYVPGDGITEPAVHMLSVSPASDTYSMNLSNTDVLYDVAALEFHADDTLLSTTDAEIIPNTPAKKQLRENYYKVYITPNSVYVPGRTDYGGYKFTSVLDPTKTIAYDLYMKTGTGGDTETALKNAANISTFPSSVIIASVSGSTASEAYRLNPRYTVNKETYNANNNLSKYSEFWDISGAEIYLKVTDETNHPVGQYTSTIYFTLVSN